MLDWKNNKVKVGVVLTVVMLGVLALGFFFKGKAQTAAPAELSAEAKYEIDAARVRIETCRAFVVSNGSQKGALRYVDEAVAELEAHKADPKNKSISWVDNSLRSAYSLANTPRVVGALQQDIDELSSYMNDVIKRPADKTRAYKHLEQARIYTKLYASGGGDALPLLARESLVYARQLADGMKVTPTQRMVVMLDRLVDAEAAAEEAPKENLRLRAHARQARRYFDAGCNSLRHRANWRLLELTEAECDYVAKIAADPTHFVVVKDDDPNNKDYVPSWLKLVDELVAQIKTVEKDLERSEEAVKALSEVRKTFDYLVGRMSKGESGYNDDVWLRQSLNESARTIQRELNKKGMHRLDEPFDSDFQTWIDQYRKDNPNSWINGKKVEFWIVPDDVVGKPQSVELIQNREHAYLTNRYKGRSVLAVIAK